MAVIEFRYQFLEGIEHVEICSGIKISRGYGASCVHCKNMAQTMTRLLRCKIRFDGLGYIDDFFLFLGRDVLNVGHSLPFAFGFSAILFAEVRLYDRLKTILNAER